MKFMLLDSSFLLCFTVLFCHGEKYPLHHPQENYTTRDFIITNGFPFEEHLFEGPDGVINVLHRIPHGPNESYTQSRIPVLMFHALFTSSKMWAANKRNTGLAYILVDNGFDVWLANARGSFYSLQYNRKLQNNPKFWDFSFQELGMVDCPLMIDFILNTTGHKKLFYIGMSMGTTIGFMMLSTRTEYNDKLIAFLGLSPVAYMKYSSYPFLYIAFISYIQQRMFGNTGSLPDVFSYMVRVYLKPICSKLGLFDFCVDLFVNTAGDRITPIEEKYVPLLLAAVSDMTSMKTMAHYWQLFATGEFRKFDYGNPEENMKNYNQSFPPEFDVSRITTPVALFPALYDTLGDSKDVGMLVKKLPNLKFNSPIMTCRGCGHVSTNSMKALVSLFPKLVAFMKKTILFPQK